MKYLLILISLILIGCGNSNPSKPITKEVNIYGKYVFDNDTLCVYPEFGAMRKTRNNKTELGTWSLKPNNSIEFYFTTVSPDSGALWNTTMHYYGFDETQFEQFKSSKTQTYDVE